ncbi:4-(cytidine 5'-diphospho)-2-C-methyl-D-erythritol kinase [Azospira sp. I09]|uniref:4-(cytidine 5'-diphospho)-2-C-methyl-D-erythritol kinase n=1 Tax=Azospira sp. I09 TaxID=1765049 RepID=UPI0012605B2B|nr:4-(cytidine 5'-diphospho)-2-C-methyl-D-erythritol kinase [Azospira sp. I09]BBN89119.1 4-diphosphocytidyl-2-C-methyl-D-erythritol kinase [Azospira sp. I09]
MNPAWTWDSAYPAPAKLNLFLHVVGRRADGYHLLQTLFRFVDYGDTLHFAPREDGRVRLLNPLPGVPEESDLTVRAARLLQQAANCTRGADIRLEKRLPMGGGLGGGSSDAATVLLALNHLWQLGLSRERLQALGLTLGADVPVFVFGRTAFAEGVGEALQAVPAAPAWYLVLQPPVAVPTVDIFRAPELKRDTPAMAAADWRPGLGGNDLEPVACARFPEVARHLAWLQRFGRARMSGSGACVFAEFPDQAGAEAALAQLPPDMRGWVAPGLDSHPLYGLLP